MSIVSSLLQKDIDTLRTFCSPDGLASIGLLGTGDAAALNASDNKFISDACSTRESVELVNSLGQSGGRITALTIAVRGECDKHVVTGTKTRYVSPHWAAAVRINKLAAAIRQAQK
jgi:hypothetical protein